MKITTISILSLLLLAVAPVQAQVDVESTVTEFRIKEVPPKRVFGNEAVGTTVILRLVSKTKGGSLTGADAGAAEFTFFDSTGKDLFAEGKKTTDAYSAEGGMVYGGMAQTENRLTVMKPQWIGRDRVKPGEVYLRCHALATPAPKAGGVTIKGKLAVYTSTGKTKTARITKAQLTSGKPFKVGDWTMNFQSFGGGSSNKRSFSYLEINSFAALKDIKVVGSDEDKPLIEFDGKRIKSYNKEMKDTDQIEITYFVPAKSTVDIDLNVNAGSIGN